MFRKIAILAVLGIVLAGVVGSAASLGTVSADDLGAGDAVVATCDNDGVALQWKTQVQDNADTHGHTGFQVIGIEVSGINAACEGQHMLASISKLGSHYMMGRASAVLGTGGTAVIDQWLVGGKWVGAGPMVVDVDDIHILIKENLVAYDG